MATANRIVVIEPPAAEPTRQGMPQFFGIGEDSAGATGISMNLTAFPPAASATAHLHRGFETTIYTVSGRIAVFFGEKLEQCVELRTGSFCFIPPDVAHKAYNLSTKEPALAVTARNDPREQESVILTPEADDGTPDKKVAQLRRDLST